MEMRIKGIFVLYAVVSIILIASFAACSTQTDSPETAVKTQAASPGPTLAPTSAVLSPGLPDKSNSTNTPSTTQLPVFTLDPAPPSAYQQVVDSLRSLATGAPIPASFKVGNSSDQSYLRPVDAFDVNNYFTVLNHLTMQPGYVLDYIYHDYSLGAQPYIYARKTSDPPFNTLTELTNTLKEGNLPFYDQNKLLYTYLEHVRVDDTPEGFFQFISLRITGAQFYLFWHAGLSDHKIICDLEALDKTLLSLRGLYGQSDEKLFDVQKQSRNLDLGPQIEIQDNSVIVKVVIFSKWGGLIREEYTITRQFPHKVIDSKTVTLIPYNCGIVL
jgi:hypothetical protein